MFQCGLVCNWILHVFLNGLRTQYYDVLIQMQYLDFLGTFGAAEQKIVDILCVCVYVHVYEGVYVGVCVCARTKTPVCVFSCDEQIFILWSKVMSC